MKEPSATFSPEGGISALLFVFCLSIALGARQPIIGGEDMAAVQTHPHVLSLSGI